jgi:hypothetical protein
MQGTEKSLSIPLIFVSEWTFPIEPAGKCTNDFLIFRRHSRPRSRQSLWDYEIIFGTIVIP